MFHLRAVLQQLCCIHRPESAQRSLDRIQLEAAAPQLPPNARSLSQGFGKVKTKLRIVYTSTGPDADRFDEAFHLNDLKLLVELMDSTQAVETLLEPKHPWAEDPRTVGALSAMQLAMLASMDDSSVREDIGKAGAIPALVRLLKCEETDSMQAAVVALKYLTEESGPNATAAFEAGALPSLIQFLKHPMAGLRGAAASCLRNMHFRWEMKKAMQFSLIWDKLRGSPAAVINLVVVLGIVITVFTVCMIETTCDCMFETVIAGLCMLLGSKMRGDWFRDRLHESIPARAVLTPGGQETSWPPISRHPEILVPEEASTDAGDSITTPSSDSSEDVAVKQSRPSGRAWAAHKNDGAFLEGFPRL
eukprot:symbB.v1.2.038181.t1/scaffold5862.1/size23015/2